MAEKQLKARLAQKHDIKTNWDKATNFVPMAGEMIIYDPETDDQSTKMKIGNGIDTVIDLPFVNLDKVYSQNEEPTDAEDGSLWVDLDSDELNLGGGSGDAGSNITVDSEFSTTSTNPVQNSIITSAFNEMTNTVNTISEWTMPGALTWNGVIGDKFSMNMGNMIGEISEAVAYIVQVSTEYPDIYPLLGLEEGAQIPAKIAIGFYNGSEDFSITKYTFMDIEIFSQGGAYFYEGTVDIEGIAFPLMLALVPYDGFDFGNGFVLNKGVYFITHNINMTEELYMAAAYIAGIRIPYYSFAQGTNEEAQPTLIFDGTISYDAEIGAGYYILNPLSIPVDNRTYTITINNESYTSTAHIFVEADSSVTYLGNLSLLNFAEEYNTGESYLIVTIPQDDGSKATCFILSDKTTEDVYLKVVEKADTTEGSELPTVTETDNGKVLSVVSGAWAAAELPNSLPTVTETDNGKFLRVVAGAWAAVTIPNAEEASF